MALTLLLDLDSSKRRYAAGHRLWYSIPIRKGDKNTADILPYGVLHPGMLGFGLEGFGLGLATLALALCGLRGQR